MPSLDDALVRYMREAGPDELPQTEERHDREEGVRLVA
jgi:hypothetical protein